jgi:peroxiredoxin Q/BCP
MKEDDMTNELAIGDKSPAFDLPTDNQGKVSLADLKGKKVVLYFYPKDNTPGCTQESKDFRDAIKEFEACNTVVLGISKDSVASHEKFKTKLDLPFPLLSDEGQEITEAFGCWKEKNMYGKKFMGIERSTFLIDGEGVLRQIWRKVKVNGHVDEVLEAAKAL